MQFPTATFVAFFGAVLVAAWSARSHRRLRQVVIVAASCWFYASWDVRFLALLGGVVLLSWAAGRGLDRWRGRRGALVLGAVVTADLLALGLFKYYSFFVDSLTTALAHVGLGVRPPLLQVALPVGVSFYVFQAISYAVDVRRGRVGAAGLLDVCTWLTFFPTVTSGPITRAGEFLPQLAGFPQLRRSDLARAYWLIGRGLLKKLVLASFLASAVTDKAFANPAAFSSATLLVAIYAYAAQIYCDFSGYTDMAIGIAGLLGFSLPDNFDRPYAATSIQDFWSRWHMTLSRWLRDYLFAPLTGRRQQHPARVYASIVAVMLLAGLWHGAAWGFVIFGLIHGLAMATERWRRNRRRRLHRPLPRRTALRTAAARLATFHIVCLGWVFFGTGSVTAATDMIAGLWTNWGLPVTRITPLLLAAVAAVIAAQLVRLSPPRLRDRVASLPPVAQAAAFAFASVPILALGPTTVPSFIYYRF